MITLKIENGKNIVTVNGDRWVFKNWKDAIEYIVLRRKFN